MIRLGIIGVESSHTASIIRTAALYEDVCITAVWGETPELTQQISERFHLDCGVSRIADMIGRVDGVMVTLRDGALHLDAVRPFWGHDIAIWIDKPFTASIKDAEELLSLFELHHTPFSGGSFVKLTEGVQAVKKQFKQMNGECMSGYLSFWTQLDSPYSGMHFYSHHLIESMLEVFGCGVRSVLAKRCADTLTVTACYDTFIVLMNYGVNILPLYGGVFGKERSFMTEIDFGDAENRQLDEFLEVIRSGNSPYPAEFFLTAVKISNAIVESLDREAEVEI